jgi:hypothetical protein
MEMLMTQVVMSACSYHVNYMSSLLILTNLKFSRQIFTNYLCFWKRLQLLFRQESVRNTEKVKR